MYLEIINGLLALYNAISGMINKAAEAAKQNGELTQEQHDALQAHMDGEAERPEWLPSPGL